jgi:hypothetical protein
MNIIGAGFGRTGTMSLSRALEQIGFAPCYHFIELFKRPGHIKIGQAAADGETFDWRGFLGVPQPAGPFPHINDRSLTRRLYLATCIILLTLLAGAGPGFIWLLLRFLD